MARTVDPGWAQRYYLFSVLGRAPCELVVPALSSDGLATWAYEMATLVVVSFFVFRDEKGRRIQLRNSPIIYFESNFVSLPFLYTITSQIRLKSHVQTIYRQNPELMHPASKIVRAPGSSACAWL